VYIGTNVSYAGYQELGVHSTGYKGANGGRGYLRPAVTDNKRRIEDIFRAELGS
jgi:phage gpG-like protein